MKVAAHAVTYHEGKAWLCICVEWNLPFRNPGSATDASRNVNKVNRLLFNRK